MAPSQTLLATARAYLNALSTISAEGIEAITTPSFTATVGPTSTGLTGTPLTRDALVQRYQGLKSILSSMNVKIEREWPPMESSNQVIIWVTASADFLPEFLGDDSKDDWTMKPEAMFAFTMDKTGEKVDSLFEFQDNVALRDMEEIMGRAMARLASRGGAGKE